MTTLPEEAVKAMPERIYAKVHGASTDVISGQRGLIGGWNEHQRDGQAEYVRADLAFLPVQGAVKKLEWGEMRHTDDYSFAQDAETPIGRYIATDTGWFLQGQSGWKSEDNIEAAKAAAQADYEARILSALEPSAARELALEEAARICDLSAELSKEQQSKEQNPFIRNALMGEIATATILAKRIRALSSPDHADAGKVEGDGAGCTDFDLVEQVEALIRQNTRLRHGKATDQVAADIIALVQRKMTQVAYLRPKDIDRLATPGVSGAINVQIANVPFIGCTVPVFAALPSAPSEGAE